VTADAGAAGTPADKPADDPAEVARLRARLAELESERAPKHPRGSWWRGVVAFVLVVVVALLAPLAVVAMWAQDEVGDTDRYVANVAPLASDPAVQAAVIERVTDEILLRIDVEARTDEVVDALTARGVAPETAVALRALTTPVEGAIEGFVTDQVTRIVQSEVFAEAWEAANRDAHTQLVALLTGQDTESVQINDDTVVLNLGPFIETVKGQLEEAGFTLVSKVPVINYELTIIESEGIASAQRGFDVLSAAARWLPILALLALAGAIVAARDKRRIVLASGLAVAASMVVLGFALNVGRQLYLDAVPVDALPQDAAAAIYDTLVRFIRFNLRALIVLGLAVAIGAWLTGASTGAVNTRRWITGGVGSMRGGAERAGLDTGPVGAWVYANKRTLRWAVVALALVIYLLADHPTGSWTFGLVIATVVVLLVVEFLARPPGEGPPTGSEQADLTRTT
jgi:hypothetical protein